MTKKLNVELSSSEYDLFLLMIGAGGGVIAQSLPMFVEDAAALTNKLLADSENFIPVEVRDGIIQRVKSVQ